MVDLLLKIIENFGKLVEYRNAKKHRAFKELAEPMFNELLEAHKDYILNFQQARLLAEQNPRDPKPAIEYLEKQRTAFEPIRVKLAAMAEGVSSTNTWSDLDPFLHSVGSYFPVGDLFTDEGTASTCLIAELRRRFLPKENPMTQMGAVRLIIWNTPASAEQRKLTDTLSSRRTVFKSPTELIDAFIALQQEKWKTLSQAYAKVKAADLAV